MKRFQGGAEGCVSGPKFDSVFLEGEDSVPERKMVHSRRKM